MKNYLKLLNLGLLLLMLKSCGITAVLTEQEQDKKFWKDEPIILRSKQDINIDYKARSYQVAVSDRSSFSLRHPAGSIKAQLHDTATRNASTRFYKVDFKNYNWLVWDSENKELAFFKSDANNVSDFKPRRSEVGPRLSEKGGFSKGKALELIQSVRLKTERENAERKRIQDSIFQANTTQGKTIANLKATFRHAEYGLGGRGEVCLEIQLQNGQTLKSNCGGLTSAEEFTFTSNIGTINEKGQLRLPNDFQAFGDHVVRIEVKAKHHPKVQALAETPVIFKTSLQVNARGKNGSTSAGSSSRDKVGSSGGNGGSGEEGQSVKIVTRPIASRSSGNRSLAEVKVWVGGNLQHDEIMEANANIVINAQGGDGANGGRGGDGKDGISSCKSAGFFPGGMGGAGGNGGNGGKGGSIEIENQVRSLQIEANVQGGKAGRGGSGGRGGKDCECVVKNSGSLSRSIKKEQPSGANGRDGRDGASGRVIRN